MSSDGTTAIPSQAITRLKQSTQYARVLPIIGLSISSRGVEFLKHTKDRLVICFHDIRSIHCACQDPDLRYFAYVTREHRLTNGMSHTNSHTAIAATVDNKHPLPPSPTLSISSDYHHYCHVFVVKSEAMSTEVIDFVFLDQYIIGGVLLDHVNIWSSIRSSLSSSSSIEM